MASHNFENVHVLSQTENKPSAALIFLHGVGFSGKLFKTSFVNYLDGSGHPYIKMYFPTAPEKYLTLEKTVISNWFDVYANEEGNTNDADIISNMIENKIREIGEEDGIPPERVIIGGHSQGGMVAMYAAYVHGVQCGGVVAISAHFPFNQGTKMSKGLSIPLLTMYGSKDVIVHTSIMENCWNKLRVNRIHFDAITLIRGTHKMSKEFTTNMFNWLEKKYPPV